MTDRRFDFDELKAWEEKVRDPEVQRRFEEAWAAEGDDTVGDFIREQEEAKVIADGLIELLDGELKEEEVKDVAVALAGLLGGKWEREEAKEIADALAEFLDGKRKEEEKDADKASGTSGGKRKGAKKNEDEASGTSEGKRKKPRPHISKLRSLTEGVVVYRCRRRCVLAAAVPAKNGDVFLVWRGGKGVRLIDPETLQRWRDGGVPDSADADAVAEVLDRVKGFEDRFGVAARYRTSSGRESRDLGREGEEFRARGARLSDLPPSGIIELTCEHMDAVLRVGDVREDLKSGKRDVILPK